MQLVMDHQVFIHLSIISFRSFPFYSILLYFRSFAKGDTDRRPLVLNIKREQAFVFVKMRTGVTIIELR